MRGIPGIVAAAVLVAGCQQQAVEPNADGAWVRLPAVQGNPGAAYFTLKGGSSAATLVKVDAPFAVRAELHESMEGHAGMAGHKAMSMQPVKDIAVPAGGTAVLAPSGKHVMLYDVAPTLKAGERAPLTLSFADGRKITVQAVVVGAGDPAPR